MTTRKEDRMAGYLLLLVGWFLIFTTFKASGDLIFGIAFGGLFMICGSYPIIVSFQEDIEGRERP